MCIAEYFSTLLLQVQFQLNDDNWTRMGGGQGGGAVLSPNKVGQCGFETTPCFVIF